MQAGGGDRAARGLEYVRHACVDLGDAAGRPFSRASTPARGWPGRCRCGAEEVPRVRVLVDVAIARAHALTRRPRAGRRVLPELPRSLLAGRHRTPCWYAQHGGSPDADPAERVPDVGVGDGRALALDGRLDAPRPFAPHEAEAVLAAARRALRS